MSSQIPPLVCHTPPPIDFDDADDDADDYGPEDIPEDDGIGVDEHSGADCLDEEFGDFATVPRRLTPEPIPGVPVIEKVTEEITNIPVLAATKGVFVPRIGNDSPPSLILPTNNFIEDDEVVSVTVDEDEYDFQPFGCPSQPPEPPPEDNVSLPSLHLDADTSKSEDDDPVPTQPNPSSATGSGIETEVDLPAVAAPTTAERTTPVIHEGGRFDDNTENDFTDFTTASNERSSVVLEVPTANDVSFELDDYAQLESTPSADSNFVSQQSRTDFATFDADFSKFDSFQASFPATVDDAVAVKTPLDEAKSMPSVEPQTSAKNQPEQLPEDEFDDFQEFATFSEQPVVSVSANQSSLQPATSFKSELGTNAPPVTEINNMQDSADPTKHASECVGNDDDDDFGEFSDFKQPDVAQPSNTLVPSFSLENVQKLLETMFPNITPEPHASDTGQQSAVEHIPTNSVHSQLQDFDNTSALAYQYSKSTSSKTLVTALGIDSRNIMYGPKWNSSMPRFAANLSFNPLEPLKPGTAPSKDTGSIVSEKNASLSTASKNAPMTAGLDPLQTTGLPSSSVPAVQFDWNSSGLVNPLEASHAHTLLLDLEQLEVMASLNDKINVDSSSYPPALRSTSNIANTVQRHSPTTTATTITTPLLLSPSSPRTSLPSPSQPKQPPKLPSTLPPLLAKTTTTTTTTISTTTSTTINTQTHRHGNNGHQSQTKPNENQSVDAGTDGGNLRAPLDGTTTSMLFFVDDHHGHDHDLLISTSATTTTTTTPTPIIDFTPLDHMITHTASPLITPRLGGARISHGNTCLLLSGNDRTDLQLIGFEMAIGGTVGSEPATATSASDRPQSFDDYLDLSVQEMLQKATTGQPTDGAKGEILDPEVPEDAGTLAADDIAVMAAVPASATVSPPAHLEDDEDVRSLDFTANATGSSNVQYSATLPPHANLHELQTQPPVGPMQPQSHYPSPPQQQPMSISTSPNNVPMVRTIKLQETHIFTPSRGGTPVSRDITDRDIVVREYHDVEYSLDKPPTSAAAVGSRAEPDFDEFNEFQSVPVVAPSITPGAAVSSYARPVIGQSPTEELERCGMAPMEVKQNGVEQEAVVREPDGSEDDDDFTEFQAATVPTPAPAAPPPVNKPVSNVQHNRSITSSPVMLLSPAILLPQQASTPAGNDTHQSRSQPMSQINWPEPGIDPDELARFEAAFAKPATQKAVPPPTAAVTTAAPTVSGNQSAPKPTTGATACEEDEWTDFISSKPVVPAEPTAVAPSVASNLQKAPVAAAPATGVAVQEEWTDFISSTPTTDDYTSQRQNRLSSSQNNFNYSRPSSGTAGTKAFTSWAQPQLPPPQFSSWNSNSLYYNPMSSMPVIGHQQQYGAPQQAQQFYGRSENAPTFGASHGSSINVAGASRVPTHSQHHQHHHHHHHHQLHNAYQHHQAAGGARVLAQQPMHLLPELSFITPNAGGQSASGPGAKPATHSFLSNVISSNSFTKK